MKILINKTTISKSSPCYIVAEMSGNHKGKIENAINIIREAKACGANAIKLQTYRADTITLDSDREDFLIPETSPWANKKNLYNLYKEAFTPWEWHEELFKEALDLNIDIFSSPFDHSAIDFLEKLNSPAYKIASPEITDIPLIKKAAQTKKPIILSTGLATKEDIELAVKTINDQGNDQIILLKCTSAYPAPLEEANLTMIKEYEKYFNCLVGISDHTNDTLAPAISTTLGGVFVEKHFTLKEIGNTVDSFFSLDQDNFKKMVKAIRETEKIIGKVTYDITESARSSLNGRRSLYISNDIKQGEFFSPQNIKSVRPSMGLHPKYYETIIGTIAKKNFKKGDRLTIDDLSMRSK